MRFNKSRALRLIAPLFVAMVAIWLIVAILLQKRSGQIDDKVGGSACTLEGKSFSEGALVRDKDGIIQCRNGRWTRVN